MTIKQKRNWTFSYIACLPIFFYCLFRWFLGFDWTALREKRLKAPLIQPVANNLDLSNFEKYPKDKLPPDETSGWDDNF